MNFMPLIVKEEKVNAFALVLGSDETAKISLIEISRVTLSTVILIASLHFPVGIEHSSI